MACDTWCNTLSTLEGRMGRSRGNNTVFLRFAPDVLILSIPLSCSVCQLRSCIQDWEADVYIFTHLQTYLSLLCQLTACSMFGIKSGEQVQKAYFSISYVKEIFPLNDIVICAPTSPKISGNISLRVICVLIYYSTRAAGLPEICGKKQHKHPHRGDNNNNNQKKPKKRIPSRGQGQGRKTQLFCQVYLVSFFQKIL